jgi:hypothetical protein
LSRQYGHGLRRPEVSPSFLSRRGRAGRLRCFANRDSSDSVGVLHYATGDRRMSGQTDRPDKEQEESAHRHPEDLPAGSERHRLLTKHPHLTVRSMPSLPDLGCEVSQSFCRPLTASNRRPLPTSQSVAR